RQATTRLQAFIEVHDSLTQMVAFYLAARLLGAIHYVITGFLVPLVKGMMAVQVLNILLGAAFWIASTTVSTTADGTTTTLNLREASGVAETDDGTHEGPLNATRLVLVFIALAIDLF